MAALPYLASGFAVAVLVVWGGKYVPGIFLGALLAYSLDISVLAENDAAIAWFADVGQIFGGKLRLILPELNVALAHAEVAVDVLLRLTVSTTPSDGVA